MSSLITHNAIFNTNDYTGFINDITTFLTTRSNGGIVVTDDPMNNPNGSIYTTSNSLIVATTRRVNGLSSKGFKFSDFDDICFGIIAGIGTLYETTLPFATCIPLIRSEEASSSYPDKRYTAFYSDNEKTYTSISYESYNNVRTMLYTDDKTRFVSFGLQDTSNSSITISEHTFTYIDDPTITKRVLCVTSYDGYITFYDSYGIALPWYLEKTNHNGHNIGKSNAINAYKFMIKGYYCDNLYYFDGGNIMPSEGVSTMGGIKFLKVGCNNLFIKMD